MPSINGTVGLRPVSLEQVVEICKAEEARNPPKPHTPGAFDAINEILDDFYGPNAPVDAFTDIERILDDERG